MGIRRVRGASLNIGVDGDPRELAPVDLGELLYPRLAVVFAAYAGAFGGFGASVERTEDFPATFQDAQASGKPAIVRLAIDPEAITPATTLAKIRAKSLAEKSPG